MNARKLFAVFATAVALFGFIAIINPALARDYDRQHDRQTTSTNLRSADHNRGRHDNNWNRGRNNNNRNWNNGRHNGWNKKQYKNRNWNNHNNSGWNRNRDNNHNHH
jgi:hypothetical protein